MKVGLFFEHQVPRPWAEGDERRVLLEALEQCELADRIGIDTAWVVEHHYLEEYSHSSAPEVFLAAVSQRTERLRLGHGIVQMPPAFNHPVRVAERVATLDLLSGGRVELGTGESSSEAELGGFGIEPADKRAQWREGLEVTLRCMTETPFTGHRGDVLTIPPRNVVPKPHQRPHPPVWVACTRRDTIHLAAQLGIGALSFAFFDPEEARQWVADYYGTLASEAMPIGDAVNANLACVTTFMCHADEEEAIRRGAEGTNFLGYSLAHYYVFGRHRPGVTDVWAEYQQHRAEAGYDPDAVRAAAAAGDTERLGARAAGAGVEGLRGAVGTPARTKKVSRTRRDGRASFLVESGERWAELRGVHLSGTARVVDEPGLIGRVRAALDAKYSSFRTPRAEMPDPTRRHYEVPIAVVEIRPEGRILTWDNARLP